MRLPFRRIMWLGVYVALTCVTAQTQVWAQPVIFSMGTGTGNDTLEVGSEGSITFHVDANGADVRALQIFSRLDFTTGNLIGAISDSTNFFFSSAAGNFEIQAFSSLYGHGTNPDSIFFGAVDVTPPGWVVSDDFARITFTPTDTGTIYIDSAMATQSGVLALDQFANEFPFIWQADTIHVTLPAGGANGDVNCDGVISSADIVYMVSYVFKGGSPPCD